MRITAMRTLMVAAALAATLSACDDDHPFASEPVNTTQDFSTFATQTFKAPANSTPVSLDTVTLVYDVNDDPNAFNALLM